MTFPEFTKKFIFDPLQMTSTQFSRPTDGSACELYTVYTKNGYTHKTNPGAYCYPDYPSGQLWSTPGDLAKFSLAMLKRGNLGYATSDGADCLYSQVTGTINLTCLLSFDLLVCNKIIQNSTQNQYFFFQVT